MRSNTVIGVSKIILEGVLKVYKKRVKLYLGS